MYKFLIAIFILFFSLESFSQSRRDLTPNKRKNTFGKRDFGNYKPYGIQLSVGGIYLHGKENNTWVDSDTSNGRYRYNYNPERGFGGFAEIGMAHFPSNGLSIPIAGRKIKIFSYWDWGIGVKFYGAEEKFRIEYLDNEKNVISTDYATARFNHILPYARFTGHRNFYLKSGHFLDLGLGANFDYRSVGDSYNYDEDFLYGEQKYSKQFFAQMHASIGFGFKIRRGFYVIPSVGTPLVGFYEWNKGNPSLQWFSSTYRPFEARLKFIWLFKDRIKGCNSGTEDDQKRNKEYMQNR
ncbi:MAG: hypothetical protein KJ941_08780 [Bacteroidetes bacterium]|nr:hypothetical protein [Bacteroidota bacterium]